MSLLSLLGLAKSDAVKIAQKVETEFKVIEEKVEESVGTIVDDVKKKIEAEIAAHQAVVKRFEAIRDDAVKIIQNRLTALGAYEAALEKLVAPAFTQAEPETPAKQPFDAPVLADTGPITATATIDPAATVVQPVINIQPAPAQVTTDAPAAAVQPAAGNAPA